MSTTAIALQPPKLTETSGATQNAQFEELYQHYHRKVFSLSLRMLGHHQEAEDVTQEVFCLVFRKLHTYRGDSTLSTWLYRVTVNAVLMHLRRNKKWSSEVQTEDGDIESTHDWATLFTLDKKRPETRIVNQLDLERAMVRLPPGCRMVFVLHDVEGFEHKEISQALGISEGTSKSQLHDARLKLRKML